MGDDVVKWDKTKGSLPAMSLDGSETWTFDYKPMLRNRVDVLYKYGVETVISWSSRTAKNDR